MVTVWSLLALCAAVAAANKTSAEEGPCSQRVLLACAYPTAMEQIRFATKAEDLETYCPHLQTGLRCIDDYTRACLKPEQRSHFYRLYTGASMVLTEICTEGPYQDEFLRLAPCMNNVTEEYRGCVARYEEALEQLSSLDISQNPAKSEALKGICKELHDYLSCSKDVVRETCGEEAAVFTGGFLDKMTNSLLWKHCTPVTRQAGVSVDAAAWLVLISAASALGLVF